MHTHRDSGSTEHKADMSTKENWHGISSLKYWVYNQKKVYWKQKEQSHEAYLKENTSELQLIFQ